LKLKKKKLTAFALVITEKDKKPYVTQTPKYHFDPMTRAIQLLDDDGHELKKIDLTQENIIKVDIYDQTNPAKNYVETILR